MTRSEKREQIKQVALSAEHFQSKDRYKHIFDKHSHIAVYGAGNAGRAFYENLSTQTFDYCGIDCFLDRRATDGMTYLGLPVYKADAPQLTTNWRKDVLVVVAVVMTKSEYEETIKDLKLLGYTHFIRLCLDCLFPLSDESCERSIFTKESDNIVGAFDLMSDEHSENVFAAILNAHARLEYDIGVLSKNMTQYIDVNVPFRYKYCNFIDCGAFTGDTLEDLVKSHHIEHYVGFEPDLLNYTKLSATAEGLHNKPDSAILLPLAVSSKNEFLNFTTCGSSSKIDSNGKTIIQTVRLDDMLKVYSGLMIKMDIEGAETAALNGARGIITKTAPDLAICVYHKVSDMWRIPLMLKEWVPEYRFYMRNHHFSTLETVLYATLG